MKSRVKSNLGHSEKITQGDSKIVDILQKLQYGYSNFVRCVVQWHCHGILRRKTKLIFKIMLIWGWSELGGGHRWYKGGGMMKNLSVREKRFHLQNFVNKSMMATMGLTEITEGECQKMVRTLVQMGKLSKEQGNQLLDDLNNRVQIAKETFEKRVEESVIYAVRRINAETQTLVAQMDQKINQIETRIDQLIQHRAVNG